MVFFDPSMHNDVYCLQVAPSLLLRPTVQPPLSTPVHLASSTTGVDPCSSAGSECQDADPDAAHVMLQLG